MSILIKNGTVVTAADFHRADVLIEGEHIKAIGHDLEAPGAEVIDAKGQFVLPGGIDPHVHLDMPFMGTFSSDNYETGTLAALHGGTTTVIDPGRSRDHTERNCHHGRDYNREDRNLDRDG